MEGKSEKTAKKFSFRKRQNAKSKKDGDLQPVDHVTVQDTSHTGEDTQRKDDFEQENETRLDDSKTPDEASPAKLSEEPSPSGVEKAKKSKRKTLFKRNSKKSSESFEGPTETVEKSNEGDLILQEATGPDQTQEVLNLNEGERKPLDNSEQSDGEGNLTSGEISEAEAEILLEQESDERAKNSQKEKGTKRKSFFKRGLSLKRRKSKSQKSEAKDAAVEQPSEKETQNETKTDENSEKCSETIDKGLRTEGNSPQSAEKTITETQQPDTSKKQQTSETTEPSRNGNYSQDEINDAHAPGQDTLERQNVNKVESLGEKHEILLNNDSNSTTHSSMKKKVSFIGADGAKLESSCEEDDSPSLEFFEAVDESDDDTVTADDGPSNVKEVTIVTECSEPLPEGDEDDLTEVSSMASELLLSSDAPDTISTSDASRLYTFTDTDETGGSRITLQDISEESETETKSEERSETQVTGEAESKHIFVTNGNNEKQLLGNGSGSKDGEWEMVNKSYDMSVELSRVRKQTLFGVKRLCCSVM